MKRVDFEKDKDGQPLRTQHEHIDNDDSNEESDGSPDKVSEEHEHMSKQVEDSKPKHHYARDIIIGLLVIIVCILGFTSCQNNHNNQQSQQNTSQPSAVHKTIVNHPIQNQNQNNQISKLQNEMNQLKMTNQQQANLISKIQNQKPAVRTKIYDYVQTVYKYIPVQSFKRKATQFIVNHNLK